MTESARRGVCVVIGAGEGLGGAIARAFAREGLAVCVTRRPRHFDEVEVLAQSIRAGGGRAHAFGVDARREEDVVALVDNLEVTLKRLRRRGASIALEPANQAYETRIFGPDRVRVQGRLVGLLRRY